MKAARYDLLERECQPLEKSQAEIFRFPRGGVSIECGGLAATSDLARVLSQNLRSGDIILLNGALAAGKTTFVSLVCKALGCFDQPSSPTYVISNTYRCPKFDIIHIDAYRLKDVDEFDSLGVDEFFPEAVTFIEWGERVSQSFSSYLQIEIDFFTGSENMRVYRLMGVGSRWRSLMANLSNQHSRSL